MTAPSAAPALLAVAHGTRDQAGIATYHALLDEIRSQRPGLTAGLAFLDLAAPTPAQVLARASGPVVLVPLLLNTGYHVRIDLPVVRATAPHLDVRTAGVLGTDPLLATALGERLAEAGWSAARTGADAVVLTAAGSTDPAAAADTEIMAGLLQQRLGQPVVPAYLCARTPTPADAVAALRATGHRRVAVARYLMAPGHFSARAQRAGGCLTSAPLGAHPDVARLVLKRFDEASPRTA
ncbi:CbiX/SirB N-terminal domain-containing protein [Streptomyces sp. NPDC052052]|uniref:sirohydrochlorin chelatase n=1 Tax=Streptomyces sp. NPDC052052 TaxID=3154756 RepID=UPI00341E4255